MSTYEKPMVMVNEELAEGVYAASGSNCWSGGVSSVQDWNGSHHVFEVQIQHSSGVEHTASSVSVSLSFSASVEGYSEGGGSFSGSNVTVSRGGHANGYKSGDDVTFKVWAKAADEASTKALSCSVTGFSCASEINVQGGGANGR